MNLSSSGSYRFRFDSLVSIFSTIWFLKVEPLGSISRGPKATDKDIFEPAENLLLYWEGDKKK